MPPRLVRRGPRIGHEELSAFEARLGRRLPDDYRRFLLDVNGGAPSERHREFERGIVDVFFSLNDPDESLNLEARAKYADLASNELLYFGRDDAGNRLLLRIAGRRSGEVWFQNLVEAESEGSPPIVEWFERRDMKKLADSFEAFMNSLRPHAADEAPPRS